MRTVICSNRKAQKRRNLDKNCYWATRYHRRMKRKHKCLAVTSCVVQGMYQAPLSSSHLEWETHKTHNRVCGTQGPRLRWVSIHFGKREEKCQFFSGLSVEMKRAMVCGTSGHETKITGSWAGWPALPGRHTSNCVVTDTRCLGQVTQKVVVEVRS